MTNVHKSPTALVLVLLIVQIVQVNCKLGSLKEALASVGLAQQRAPMTEAQLECIRRLGAIWACDDELGFEEQQILKEFDPNWAYDKMELKRLCNLRLMAMMMAGVELKKLAELTRVQLELERANLEAPLIELGD